jgi:hypothetical protein
MKEIKIELTLFTKAENSIEEALYIDDYGVLRIKLYDVDDHEFSEDLRVEKFNYKIKE